MYTDSPKKTASTPEVAQQTQPKAAEVPPQAPPKQQERPKVEPSSSQGFTSPLRGERVVPMKRMRKRVAERLKDAQNTYAMLSTFNEVDMTNITAMRYE